MRLCPSCGRQHPDDYRVCPICATPLPEPVAPEREARKADVDVAEYRFEIAMDMAEAERVGGNVRAASERLEWALADSEWRGAHAFAEQARDALAQLAAG